MHKKIIIAILTLVVSTAAFAQEGTTSPYSYYGIGIQKFKGTAENRSMAGISVYSDSIHTNIQNPAGLAYLRLTDFTMSGSTKTETQKTDFGTQKASTTSLDYLAIGIPMGKFGGSFGLIPTTAVGYKINSTNENSTTSFTGEGGLNRAFLALGYQIIPELSIGVDVNYNFGNIRNTSLVQGEGFQFGTREINESDLLGFSYNFGLAYKKLLNKNLEFMGSLTYTPETKFTSENDRQIATVSILPSGATAVVQNENIVVADTEFSNPSQYTIGAGIGTPKKWFVGLEYTDQKTSNFTNRSLTIDNVIYKDASKYRIGGFYIPNYNAIGSYWERVVYRGGFRYESTGLNINGEDINEFGISFGVGVPVGRLFTNINLGVEIGSRGTTNSGLVKENFFNIFLSLSLNDKWFEKRYYD